MTTEINVERRDLTPEQESKLRQLEAKYLPALEVQMATAGIAEPERGELLLALADTLLISVARPDLLGHPRFAATVN